MTRFQPPCDVAHLGGVEVHFDPHCADIAVARGLWPFKRIVVNGAWFGLPLEQQSAVLAHELYHCKALHLEIRILMIPIYWTRFAQRVAYLQELDADRFAAREGHAPALIEFIRKHQETMADFHPSPETRIEALRKEMQ